jgi:hypothetical protein
MPQMMKNMREEEKHKPMLQYYHDEDEKEEDKTDSTIAIGMLF